MKPNTNLTRTVRSAVLAAALLLPPAAHAAATSPPTPDPAAEGSFVPVQRLEFSNDEIEGGVLGPEGEILRSVPRPQHRSLIELRDHFLPEMVKSLEDV